MQNKHSIIKFRSLAVVAGSVFDANSDVERASTVFNCNFDPESTFKFLLWCDFKIIYSAAVGLGAAVGFGAAVGSGLVGSATAGLTIISGSRWESDFLSFDFDHLLQAIVAKHNTDAYILSFIAFHSLVNLKRCCICQNERLAAKDILFFRKQFAARRHLKLFFCELQVILGQYRHENFYSIFAYYFKMTCHCKVSQPAILPNSLLINHILVGERPAEIKNSVLFLSRWPATILKRFAPFSLDH